MANVTPASVEAHVKRPRDESDSESDTTGHTHKSAVTSTHKQLVVVHPEKVLRVRGQVLTNKLPGRFAKDPATGQSLKWPVVEGYKNINCTSGSPGVWKQLSPFYLGPIEVAQWGWRHLDDYGEQTYHIEMPLHAKNLENLWQYSKVWENEENAITKQPIREFFERRAEGWQKDKATRHVKKSKGPNRDVPLYSLWGTQKLQYIEARKKIYCPVYAALVKRTDAYKQLEALLDAGQNIQLLEYDAYPLGGRTWAECLNDASRPFGHGLVLACVLMGLEPWTVAAASAQ